MNAAHPITMVNWFSRGWHTFKMRHKTLIGGSVILSVFYLLVQPFKWVEQDSSGLLLLPGVSVPFLATYVAGPVLRVGWWFLCLRLVREEEANSTNIFDAFSRFGTLWMTFFIWILITIGGTFLLVIPGVIWGVKYGLCGFAVMDKALSAREAIRFSGKITQGYKGKLFSCWLISVVSGQLALPLVLGLQLLFSGQELAPPFAELVDEKSSHTLVVWGLLLYLANVLVLSPWIGATFASAYNSLAHAKETR